MKNEQIKEEILLKLKKTRKAFLIEYACGIFLIIILLFNLANNLELPFMGNLFVAGIAFTSFASAEISRIFVRYHFTPKKMVIIKGIINQNKKHVYYHPLAFVPDLNVSQTAWQRILGYGNVYLKTGGNDFEITDVDNPKMILERIETLIAENISLKKEKNTG